GVEVSEGREAVRPPAFERVERSVDRERDIKDEQDARERRVAHYLRGTSEPSAMPRMEKARPMNCGGTVASAATASAMPQAARPSTTAARAPASLARFQ